MLRPKSARRRAKAKFRLFRNLVESLESRLLLSGSHEQDLLNSIDSALQSSNGSGLGSWTSKLDDASALGKNLPLIGSVLSNLNLNAGLALNATESSLSALVSNIQQAGNNAVVSASRDLPDDIEIDFQKTVTKSVSGALNASFGLPVSLPGTVNASVSFTMSVTAGAYWDSVTNAPVFYINSSSAQLNATATATATLNPTGASLGFVSLGISGATASLNGAFAMTLNPQPPVDSSEQAGRLTLGQLTSTPISSLVNTSLTSPSPTTLSIGINTPLASSAHNVTFSWPDITNPTNVTSSLSTDPTLSALSNLLNINSASFSNGIDGLTSELEALGSTSLSNLSIFQKKLPLLNKSIASEVNFQQFFQGNFSSLTDQVPNAQGVLSSPFQNSSQLLSLLQTIPGSVDSVTSNAGQMIYSLQFNKSINDSVPLSLNLGSELNLNVTSTLNFSVGVAVNLQFGVDGSTGNFFVVVSNQPAMTLTASLNATVTGSASLGFLSISVNGGTLSGSGTGTITLEDPQTDSPATPGIISTSELASGNFGSMFNVAFTGSASASLPISTTVPGITPVTLALSWPDITDASTVNFNTSGLSQFLAFNGLSFQTVLGYLENLPTMLQNLAGPKALGGSLAFLGSSVGQAVTLGNDLNTKVIQPLESLNINTVQDLQTQLAAKVASISALSTLGLNVSSTDIDFSFDFKPSYSASASWSLAKSVGPANFLSFQTSGTVPLSASLDAKLEVGISLSNLTNPTDDFYVVEGPGSQVTGNFSAAVNNIAATATVGYLATVGITNGTASVNGSLSLPLGSGAAGTHLTLTDLLANPTDLFGSPSFTGTANVHLPLSGLPGQTTNPLPYIGLNWSDITNITNVTPDVSTINFSALNPLTNFDASSVLSSIGSVLSLIQQWGGSSIMKTNIPLINEPVSSILDFATEAESVFQKIQGITATTPSAFDVAVKAAPQAAGFLSSDVNLIAGSLDNPGSQTFDYVLQFHKTVSTSIPFNFGPGFFSISSTVATSVTFDTNLEFGYDAADGFYIVGNSNPATPAVSLSAAITQNFNRVGGMFGPLAYGISNGTANAAVGLAINLVPPGDNGNKISGSDLLENATSIISPSITGSANLNLPIGLTIGSDGPGVTTTFTASWNPSRAQPFEFGPSNSTDITDGFGPVNYDIGEFVNKIIGPVLSDIEQDNPIPQSVLNTLNEMIPVIDKTPGQLLGDYLNNPGFKLLLGIDSAINDMPGSGANTVDVSNYFTAGAVPAGNDTGGPLGGVPPAGNPTGTPTSGNFGAFKSFQQTLENDFFLKLPVLDSPATSIISILTGKPVTLVEFDPGKVSVSESYQTPKISFPLVDFGFGDVSAFLQANISASLFADVDIELTTRGLEGTYITGNKLGTGQSAKLLDGLAINDSDQYQAGLELSGGVTIGGSVDILGFSAASLSGSLTISGIIGAHINDLSYNKDSTIQGPANFQGDGPGDNEVYLDELEYLINNNGLECAIMPGGEIDATLSLSVSALGGLFSKQIASGTVTLADFNGPCTSTLTNLASIVGTSLVMNPNSATAGLEVGASIVENTTTGQPQYLRLTTTNNNVNDYQLFLLSDLSAASVHTLVLQGTNGDDDFTIDPAVTQAGGMHFLQIITGNGNDRVNLQSLIATNSTITGETINGGNGNDSITGNYAPAVITLGSGTNHVSMGTANDSVTASSGTDTITGSNGNDTVIAGSGADLIALGDGNNQVTAGSGATTISIGNGKNLIIAGTGTETINTGDGDDKIFADTGGSTITLGAGQDIVYATAGNASITGGGGNDLLVVGAGTNTVNGGTGNTTLAVIANANQTLASGVVTITGLGSTTFTNIATVSLTGGAANNSFDVSSWLGSPVQINGGGGTDTIVSNNNTSFTLADSSLQRSDGTSFALNGIANAQLTSGAADATFDVSNWHGTATLTGGAGVNTLSASNLTTATLTNTTLARAGLATISFSGIVQANLTGSVFGSAHIDASAFTGTVALFGQLGNNTLIGGSGSDYILGGAGSNVLTGNGTQDNQLVGGTGSADTIQGGPGNNLLVGSNGGSDVITTGSGASHIYTPGGHDTINAQTGNAIIYLSGAGNTVNTGASTSDVTVHSGDAGTTASDFVAPALFVGEFPVAPISNTATLPTGPVESGQWTELSGSASNGGVSNSAGTAIEPSIIATGSGASSAQIVAWADNRSGIYEIYVAKYVSGSWQELAGSAHGGGISNSTIPSRRPSITVDASGNPIVAWTEINGSSSNIFAAKYDPTANSGAGGWVALGSAVTTSGHADSAQIVNTTAGATVAWLDASSGHADVYVRRFNGTTWAALGTGADTGNGISASTTSVLTFAMATDGTKLALVWTQPGTTAGNSIYLSQFSGSTWAAINSSTSANGISGSNSSTMPTVAYEGGSIYAAWATILGGTTNIQAAVGGTAPWAAVAIDTPISAGTNQISRGAASHPVLSANGSSLDLVWIEDRLITAPDQAAAIYATRLTGGIFARQLPGDAAFDGILHRSTALSTPASLALAVDGSGHPFVAWGDNSAGSSQVDVLGDKLDITKIIYVNDNLSVTDSYTTASGAASNTGLTPNSPLNSIQAALNLTLTPGTIILVDSGTQAGFTATSADNGVLIFGSAGAPTIVSSLATLTSVSNMTLVGLQLLGSLTVTGGTGDELLNDSFGAASQVAIGDAGTLSLQGTSAATLLHNSIAGLTISGTTTNLTIENNSIQGTGIAISGASTGLLIAENQLYSLAINTASQGTITTNNIFGGGVTIAATFTGSIDHNLIHGATIGVTMSAPAPLSANSIFANKTGIVDIVASNTTGLGFAPNTLPNLIWANGVGVNLTGLMQGQEIESNVIGVQGTGVLGGTSLDAANLISDNGVGVNFSGPVQYDRIDRNELSINVQSGQLIDHDIFVNNAVNNLDTEGASNVEIFDDSFFALNSTNIMVDGGSTDVEVLNNILWANADYDLYIADNSRVGFFSDYNDLYITGVAQIVHYLADFHDILDWQQALNQFDLHSVGATVLSATEGEPRFVDASLGDLRVFAAAAGLRSTSPTIATGDPGSDLALPASYQNLLNDPSFETGVNGWTVNVGGTTQSTGTPAFNGSSYFFAGSVASGFAQQTINLLSAGYTATQLDTQSLNVSFGGRIRSASESPVDTGTLILSFFSSTDGSGTALGSDTLTAGNTTTRWQLVSGSVHIPIGARSMTYRFQNQLVTGSTDDSYLDNAFLYVLPNTVATDMGAYGNTAASVAAPVDEKIQLQSPDVYVNWTLSDPHQILWNTVGNTSGSSVQIDLYHDVSGVPVFFKNIITVADTGSYTWIPANSGLSANMLGLRIVVSLVNNSAIKDTSTETFAIAPSGTNFYINDGSTTGDQYSTAAGSNRNTGMTPSSPLPMLTTLLRTYSLNSSDTIFIDNGSYNTFQAAVFSSVSTLGTGAGTTVHGPTNNGTSATITALGYTNDGVININNANFNTITNLTVSGGEYGIWSLGGSQNLTLSFITANSASAGGIRIENNATGAALSHLTANFNGGDGIHIGGGAATMSFLTADNNAGDGIFIGSTFTSLSNSTADNNGADGFDLVNTGSAAVTNSEGSGNVIGLNVSNSVGGQTVIGNSNLSAGQGNIFHNNSQIGIDAAFGNEAIYGNTVYGQSTGDGSSTGVGIELEGNNLASENVSWGNVTGIYGIEAGTISNNRIYDNSSYGIFGEAIASMTANVIYSNGVGIGVTSSNSETLQNNLIYANGSAGVSILGSTNISLLNNTIYQITGDALDVRQSSTNIAVRDNIFWTAGGFDISVVSTSEQGFSSDYNLLYTTGTGSLGSWAGLTQTTLAAWRASSNTDANSLFSAPLFVNIAGADGLLGYTGGVDHGVDDDFHDQSAGGSFHGGSFAPYSPNSISLPVQLTATLATDAATSPAVNRGDPAAAFNLEPAPNGGFINIGAYGDTAQASESSISFVLIITPNGGEFALAGQSYIIKWRSQDTSSTVNIDLLQGSSPATAVVVSNISTGAVDSGAFTWSIPSNITPASNYFIRVTRTGSPSAIAISAAAFTIKAPVTSFYVNDGTVAVGDFTTAAGNDANDGLSPGTPKASISALLQQYNLGAGDTIFVDNGTYNISGNINLNSINSGLIIKGFSGAGGSTVINRGNTTTGSYVFNIAGATNVTLDHLSITGAEIGIVVGDNTGSTGLKITNDQIYNNLDDGIYLGVGNNGALISGNQVYGQFNQSSTDGGILTNGAAVTISNNIAHDNFWADIYVLNGSNATIVNGNTTYNSNYGIEAANASVTGNIAYNNQTDGILATGTATVTGNTAHDNTVGFFGQHAGIELQTGASGSGNVVYNNKYGIVLTGNGISASNNLAYSNSTAGFSVNGGPDTLSGNVMYSNGWGIQSPSAATLTITNNLIYNNTSGGIDIQFGDLSPAMINNTIYQPTGDGIRIEAYATNNSGTILPIRDNIIWVQSGFDLNIDSSASPALASDYNDLYATGSGQIGNSQNAGQSSLAAWQSASFNDADSISADPLFVNVANADFHVQSTHGSYKGGSLAPILNITTNLPTTVPTPSPSNDAANSPTIDRGAPGDAFNLEPTPNGSFVNLGSYGDTNQSSISPSSYVLLIHPNGGDNWATKQSFNIVWHDNQIGLTGTQTVTIDLLQGSTVTNIATGLTDTGVYAWLIPSTIASGANYQIRVTETGTSSLSDTSDANFSIVQTLGIYYVNDSAVAPGDLTTAPGNDANNGLTPNTPKADIQSVLNSYALNPGDVINVDTGAYNVSSNILLTAADNGIIIKGPGVPSASRYTSTIQADSPSAYYPMNETSGTVAADSSGHNANATYVGAPSLGQSVLFGPPATAAVGFNGSSQSVHLPSGFANIAGGFTFETWINPAATNAQENIFDLGNGTNNEIYLIKDAFTTNLQLTGSYGSIVISNAISFDTWQYIAVTITGTSVNIYKNGASIGGGTLSSAPDNITRTTNNLAAGASFSDFAGQMQETAFYSTALTSTQIANHYSAAGAAILNRNNTNSGSEDFQIDGGSNITIENLTLIGGVDAVEFTSGTNSVSDTLTNCIIYGNSSNGIDVFGFTNIADNFTLTNSIIGSNGGNGISIVNSNTPVITGNTFIANAQTGINLFSNGGIVTNNQVSLNGTGGINAGTNNTAFPMTISGNTVTANGGAGITNSDISALITGNIVSAQGTSGQYGINASGGLVINNTIFDNYIGMFSNGSGVVTQGNRVFNNFTVGIAFANGTTVTGNVIYSNGTWGIQGGNNNGPTTISNNLIYANGSGGFDTTLGNLLTLLNNTIYQPTGLGIVVTNNSVASSSVPFTFRNNIIEVGAGPAYSIDDFSFTGFVADYNDIYVTGAGSIASLFGNTINSSTIWATETAEDTHSIFLDPKFVNPLGIDGVLGYSGGVDHGGDDNFNVQSSSPTIDAADPSLPVSNEPAPNGGRANQGYTGGTAQATLSPAQSIQVVSPNFNTRVQPGQTLPITWNTNGLSVPSPSSAYSSKILSQNPLVYLKFDETSGTTAVDSSSNGLNGVYSNGPALGQTSVFGVGNGHAVAFDGGTDAVTVSSSALDLKRMVTLSAWIKPSTLAPTWQPIFYKGAGDFPHRTYSVFLNTAGFLLLSSWDGTAERFLITANGVIQANVWTHIAVVMDRNTGTAAIYINGQLAAQAAPGVFPTVDAADSIAQPLYIGYSPEDPSFRYTGEIDEAAVFSSALSAADINAQYAATTGTVHIDLTNAAGTTLQSIATGVANQGAYSWSIPSNLAPGQYKIRVTSDLNGSLTDLSDNPFLVLSTGNSYYVNGSSTGGVFTTAGGSDANDGKSPSTPMSSIQAILNADHPGPGSTIYVDTGTYNLLSTIILTSADNGITFEGVPAQTTILNRGDGNVGEYVFDLRTVSNVTFDHLGITGGYAGINANIFTTNTNITISNDLIFSNYQYEIATNDQTGWTITGNSIHDTIVGGGIAVYFPNNGSNTFTNNTVFNNSGFGFFLQTLPGSSSTVSGNTVFSNNIGIYATANNASTTVSNNTVFSNSQYGLDIESGAAAINNTVFKQTATNAVGIFILNNAEIRGNIVYDNFTGIYIQQGNASIDRNQIYSNVSAGINVISSAIPQIIDNLIYANAGPGINLNGLFNNGTVIIGNTIYEITADAVKFTSAPGVLVKNNILWTQNGYDLDFTDTTSQTNFTSDYNDLYVTGSAHIVFFNAAAQTSLSVWQPLASDDLHSISADPKFVDIDGADNVLGYSTAGAGANDGTDDNFYLSEHSPAIDDGLSWIGYSSDIEGTPRTNDPGTANTGTPDYTVTDTGSSQFVAGGTSTNFNPFNPATFSTAIPFSFPYYGSTYTNVIISSTGNIRLGGGIFPEPGDTTSNSLATLAGYAMIAPMWGNISMNVSGDNVFIDTSVTNQMTIRWVATNATNSTPLNFQATLFSDGRIRFDYGSGNTGMVSPTIGISMGDGQHYLLAPNNGNSNFTNSDSILFNTAAGYNDLGAYEFHGNSTVTTPPTLTSTTPTAIALSTSTSPVTQIGLTFSTALNSIDALAPSDFQLVGAGPDNIFGDSDDVTYTLTPQYTVGSNQITLNITGSLTPGLYRLTVNSNVTGGLHDVNGLLLDGDANGTAGGSYVRTFTVTASALNLSGNNVYVKLDADGQHIDVWPNATATGSPTQYLLSGITSILYSGAAGNDDFVLDFSAGNPVPTGGLSFTGGSGQNILKIIGTTGSDTMTVNGTTITLGSASISYSAASTIIFDGDSAGADVLTQTAQPGGGASLVFAHSTLADTINVNSGAFTIPANTLNSGIASYLLGTLSLATGTTFTVAAPPSHGDRTVLMLNTLSIANSSGSSTAQLNLTGNDLVIHNGVLGTITSLIKQGLNAASGFWNGQGIISSTAAGAALHDLALQADLNSFGSGTLATSFDGQPVTSTDVLVKFTYFGDANLDGVVNGDDYTLIDNGFNTHKTGEINGDFNFDGVVNSADYVLIDNSFNSEGSLSFAVTPATLISSNTMQIANASPISKVAVTRTKEVNQFAAPVSNSVIGDTTNSQELKKRRPSAWERLEG